MVKDEEGMWKAEKGQEREPGLLHGGDYNPEQWLEEPDILEEDIRLMKKAHVNAVTLGVFSWSSLEPEEGRYNFGWLERIVERLYQNGIYVIMATPSASRPKWLADKYPEVLRVDDRGMRMRYGGRHNFCFSSGVYREKVRRINEELGKRFASHPAVLMWHISNELSGACQCRLCRENFQLWLKRRYGSIEELNRAWCTKVWSHEYQDFMQVEPPSSAGENLMQGLRLDWNRFITDMTAEFVREEIRAIRRAGGNKPVTVNMMYYFKGLNYFKLSKAIDIASWDNYPTWNKEENSRIAMKTGLYHDVMRSLLKKPFLMMESAPNQTSWQSVSKVKRPGVHLLSSLQAVAHGANGVLYFQWRQCVGGPEKLHSAVIGHDGGENTRTFREVEEVGKLLELLKEVQTTCNHAKAALVYDMESLWAMEQSRGPRNKGLGYQENLQKHYKALRRLGLNVDFVDMESEIDGYRLVAAPMLYMFRNGFEDKIRKFVSGGGIFVLGHWSGVVDENDRCFRGGRPHGLTDVLGIRCEETDALYDWEENELLPVGKEDGSKYLCEKMCELFHTTAAETLYRYGKEFYAGMAAVTQNCFGAGRAYYIGTDAQEEFYQDFYRKLLDENGIEIPVTEIAPGVEVTSRENEEAEYWFLQNYNDRAVQMPRLTGEYESLYGEPGTMLPPHGNLVLKRRKS